MHCLALPDSKKLIILARKSLCPDKLPYNSALALQSSNFSKSTFNNGIEFSYFSNFSYLKSTARFNTVSASASVIG